MKISTKIILTTVFVGTLGIGGLTQAVSATQLPSRLFATTQHQSSTQVAEADSPNDRDSGVKEDGDREASDTPKVHISSYTKQQRKHHRKYYHTRRHHIM